MGTTTIPFEDETVGRIHDSVQGNEKKDYANYNEIQINSERSLIYSLTLYLELCRNVVLNSKKHLCFLDDI